VRLVIVPNMVVTRASALRPCRPASPDECRRVSRTVGSTYLPSPTPTDHPRKRAADASFGTRGVGPKFSESEWWRGHCRLPRLLRDGEAPYLGVSATVTGQSIVVGNTCRQSGFWAAVRRGVGWGRDVGSPDSKFLIDAWAFSAQFGPYAEFPRRSPGCWPNRQDRRRLYFGN